MKPSMPPLLKITVVYDNRVVDARCKSEWGFSCLLETPGKMILFDTGGDGGILFENMRQLGIDSDRIAVVVLSHDHWDHTGGLRWLLNRNKRITVHVLPSFSSEIKEVVKEAGVDLVEAPGPTSLSDRVVTTGKLGTGIEEQSLVARTSKGLVIITGCAHPGIENIIEHVRKTAGDDISMAFGGFHLRDASEIELMSIIAAFRKYGIRKAGPCHCSGELCRKLFREEYRGDYLDIGAGMVI